ncbi:MAG: IS4 family transposase [Candidatus Aenigmarchaeota archaeon]|nr:IS4 family transposase [Candidatus Aenigmarchaeota archaeon]
MLTVEFKKAKSVLDRINNKLKSRDFMERSRVGENDFTRNRKMPFCSLIYFMLNSIKQTLQKELTNFMSAFTKHDNITKSAFCQHRLKLKPEAFIELNNMLIDEFYTDNIIEKWKKYRLLCIDGSTLELPKSQEIIADFGVNSEVDMTPMAKISTLFDLLNEQILDATIAPSRTSEYDLAINHLDKLQQGDLLILDRGYGARWLFYLLTRKKADFVIRLQHERGDDIDDFGNSEETSKIIEVKELPKKSDQRLKNMKIDFQPFKFRLVKVTLETGEVEALATSLLDEQEYPVEIFKELYNKRWGVETNYSHLKNHIEIGNFTGYSTQVIKQDFHANAFIANIQRLIIRDAQLELNSKTKHRKHEYKINRNLSLGYMKDKVVGLLTSNNPCYYDELVKLFQIEPVPIRKNRKYPREKHKQQRKYYINQKRAL